MIESRKLAHAKGLYLEGIRDGKVQEALDEHVGERYTQHSTGVADGKEGFNAFFGPFLERTPVRDIQVVRTIEDGRYVFCHVYQNLNNGEARWVTADLFDTDENDRLVEHWDVIAEYVEDATSGRSMVSGATETEDLEKTEQNKATVQKFVDDVLIGRNIDKITDYLSTQQFEHHNPRLKDGLEGLLNLLGNGPDLEGAPEYVKVHHLKGQGNFVVIYSHLKVSGHDYACFEIFRLKNGKIVEHWDVREIVGPKETWNNSGKF